ncbi:hypothetical protein EON67_08370 [archaeon]|nr:MAG: hypothetical protein EON67_08370 [archaeon]
MHCACLEHMLAGVPRSRRRQRAGVVYSGMGPDFRVLVRKGQKKAQEYQLVHGVCSHILLALEAPHEQPTRGRAHPRMHLFVRLLRAPKRLTPAVALQESIPVLQLTREIAAIMQEFTQSGGVRPFGVSLLVAGYAPHTPHPTHTTFMQAPTCRPSRMAS